MVVRTVVLALALSAGVASADGTPEPPAQHYAAMSREDCEAMARAATIVEGKLSEVEMEKDQAIVCLVGENIRYTPGVARRVFNSLDGINIRMISQGASLLNLSFVVAEGDLKRTVAALHDEFFSELDAAVFERNEAVHA